MTQEYTLRVRPEVAADEQQLRAFVVADRGLRAAEVTALRVVKRSIDARQRQVMVSLTVRVYLNEMPDEVVRPITYRPVDGTRQAVVVGAGPGGLFAALKLIELGVKPIVVERGKNVHDRKKDIAAITRQQTVDPESNYCFGEGGAGAFSDGKLYTRSKKRGNVDRILQIFCQHGASTAILTDAHPHIGTDKLPGVIKRIRQTILDNGGEVHFGTRMDGLLIEGDQVRGITTADGQAFLGPVILATGHSARDVYRLLARGGIEMEAKGLAVGVRLEHPSALIDQIQYHSPEGRGRYLPAAEYTFVTQVEGRGVYSFCMCPGGFVVPAASGPEQVVVNGMSPANRGSRWSNAGMVVELRPEDLEALGGSRNEAWTADGDCAGQALRMMYFQESLERLCWQQAGGRLAAPAQRMADFVHRKLSYDLPQSSYAPGLISSPLHFWLPPFVSNRLARGFEHFGRCSRGFLTNEAVAIAVETRTSSPVRILRDRDTLRHVRLGGLFPCGEGAGYAGGIVSAAIDGERCAEAAAVTFSRY